MLAVLLVGGGQLTVRTFFLLVLIRGASCIGFNFSHCFLKIAMTQDGINLPDSNQQRSLSRDAASPLLAASGVRSAGCI